MKKLFLAALCTVITSCNSQQSEVATSSQSIPNRITYVYSSNSSPNGNISPEPVLPLPDGKYEGKVCHENGCTELILRDGKLFAWRGYPHCRSYPSNWKEITKGDGRIFIGNRSAAERLLTGEPRGNSPKVSDRISEIINLRSVGKNIQFDYQSQVKKMCRGAIFKRTAQIIGSSSYAPSSSAASAGSSSEIVSFPADDLEDGDYAAQFDGSCVTFTAENGVFTSYRAVRGCVGSGEVLLPQGAGTGEIKVGRSNVYKDLRIAGDAITLAHSWRGGLFYDRTFVKVR